LKHRSEAIIIKIKHIMNTDQLDRKLHGKEYFDTNGNSIYLYPINPDRKHGTVLYTYSNSVEKGGKYSLSIEHSMIFLRFDDDKFIMKVTNESDEGIISFDLHDIEGGEKKHSFIIH